MEIGNEAIINKMESNTIVLERERERERKEMLLKFLIFLI